MANKRTNISQIITLLHVSTLSCHPEGAFKQYLDHFNIFKDFIRCISNFLKIHLNIILSSMPGSPHWSFFLRFPHQNPVHASPLPHPSYMTRLSNFITRTIVSEQYVYRSWGSSLWTLNTTRLFNSVSKF
jgi:hypothetical protein